MKPSNETARVGLADAGKRGRCVLLAAALLAPTVHAQEPESPDTPGAQLKVNGSATLFVGAHNRNPNSIFSPDDYPQDAAVASRRLNTVLRVSAPSFSFLLDAHAEQLPYATERRADKVNQVYVAYDVVQSLKLRAGKQRVLWGNGFSYIPTDFINPPLNPTSLDLAKEGVKALSFDYITSDYTFTGIVARTVSTDLNGQDSRSNGVGFKVTSSAVSGLDMNFVYFRSGRVGNALGVSMQADTSVPWLPDVPGLVVFGGVATNQKSRYPQLADAEQAGPGGTIGYPAVAELGRKGPYWSGLLGGTYSIDSRRIGITAEYYRIGDAYKPGDYSRVLAALGDPPGTVWQLSSPWLGHLSYGRNQRHYANLSINQRSLTEGEDRVTDTFSYDAGVLIGLDDRSRLFSLGVKSNYWDNAELGLRTYLPRGSERSEFGSMPYTWYVEASIKLAF